MRVPGTEKWTTLDLFAFDSFEKNKINLLVPVQGATVPKKRQVLLEQKALDHLNINVGGTLEFQLPDGSTKTLPVGMVQVVGVEPSGGWARSWVKGTPLG